MERLTGLLRAFQPFRPATYNPSICARCSKLSRQSNISRNAPFSTSTALQKRKDRGPKTDTRITNIRYHLKHPLTPRPLRFSRTRYLRHWTIHRAWQLYQSKLRNAQELELQRMYESMRLACDMLSKIGRNGLPGGPDEGKLFRRAMEKKGIWSLEGGTKVGVPIEYARLQTEWPSRDGWNHEWKRG